MLYSGAEKRTRARHRDNPAVRVGSYIDVTPDWRVHQYAMVGQRVLGANGVFSDIGVEQRLTLTRRAAVALEVRRRVDFGVRENRVAAFVHLYF